MSGEEEDSGKMGHPSKAAEAKDPTVRVRELMKETKEDRKATALKMRAEGYSPPEVGAAFKIVTGTGIGGKEWGEWKAQDKQHAEALEVAGVVLTAKEKAFSTTVAAKLKTLDEKTQMMIIDLGMYVFYSVVPLVPAETPEEKAPNTKSWLMQAVDAFDPEYAEEVEKFGAAAFLAASTLKRQMNELMEWADPSSRLEKMAERALYSPNPVNEVAFDKLLNEVMRSIHGAPRFKGPASAEEIPAIAAAYAKARGISLERAIARFQSLSLDTEVIENE